MSELFIISSQQQKGFFNTFSQYLPDSSFSYITLTLQLLSWIENKTFVQSLRVTLILLWTIFTLFSNKTFEMTIVIWHYMNQTEFNFHLLFCSIWEDFN